LQKGERSETSISGRSVLECPREMGDLPKFKAARAPDGDAFQRVLKRLVDMQRYAAAAEDSSANCGSRRAVSRAEKLGG
jgi:hypothetical protein